MRAAVAPRGVLMLAFTGSVLLVVDVMLDRDAGVAAGASTLVACVALWWLLPLFVRRSGLRRR